MIAQEKIEVIELPSIQKCILLPLFETEICVYFRIIRIMANLRQRILEYIRSKYLKFIYSE